MIGAFCRGRLFFLLAALFLGGGGQLHAQTTRSPPIDYIDEKGVVLARLWGPADWYSPGARNLIKSLLETKRP